MSPNVIFGRRVSKKAITKNLIDEGKYKLCLALQFFRLNSRILISVACGTEKSN